MTNDDHHSSDWPFRLIVTGGGTGGHTYPALTTIRELENVLAGHDLSLDVLWVGTAGSLEARVAAAESIPFRAVAAGKLRRSANPLRMLNRQNARDMIRVPQGVLQARAIVAQYRADVVLSTGGYVAIPIGIAAVLTRTPLVVHEQTVRLGLANRLLARVASTVAVSSKSTLELLPGSVARSAVVTGNPVRPALFAGNADKAVATLGLSGFDPSLPTVYITGGAQGSVQINTMIGDILPWLLSKANVIHQCGAASLEQGTKDAAMLTTDQRGRYWVDDFIGPELPDVLALADLVISRSGAGTIAELTALGKPVVLIPYPASAGNEQEHNALYLEHAGAAVALTKQRANADELKRTLASMLTSTKKRAHMAQQAATLGHPDAATQLANVVLDAGPSSRTSAARTARD